MDISFWDAVTHYRNVTMSETLFSISRKEHAYLMWDSVPGFEIGSKHEMHASSYIFFTLEIGVTWTVMFSC